MKAYRKLAMLIVAVGLVVALGATFQLIGVQRGMGEKQNVLLGEVKRQNTIVESILPDFQPTEEMVGKTEGMVADLKALDETVAEMNVIVADINTELGNTISWLNTDNDGLDALAIAMGGAVGPLNLVGERTGVTLDLLNQTIAALKSMSAGLASSNAHAGRVANVMTGGAN